MHVHDMLASYEPRGALGDLGGSNVRSETKPESKPETKPDAQASTATHTTQPIEPTQPAQPVQPVQPQNTFQPVQNTAQPVQNTVQPVQSVQPVQNTAQPGQTTVQPTEPTIQPTGMPAVEHATQPTEPVTARGASPASPYEHKTETSGFHAVNKGSPPTHDTPVDIKPKASAEMLADDPGSPHIHAVSGGGTTTCQNCQTSTTPLWRRDEHGQVLCNACGLFLKLHGRRRPISLKTDVIKSRNRSKNNPVAIKRTKNNQQSAIHMPTSSPGMSSVSPSFPALSPHVIPHGSPLVHSHGSPLVHGSPSRGPILHDLNHIEHMPLSAASPIDRRPQNMAQNLAQNLSHPSHMRPIESAVRAATTKKSPTTPSTVFSYTNSPTLGPVAGSTHQGGHASATIPLYMPGTPVHQATTDSTAPGGHHLPPLPHMQPNGYSSQPTSGAGSPMLYPLSRPPTNGSPSIGTPTQPTQSSLLVPGRHSASTSPRPATSSAPATNGVVSVSHILTPQSRPESPQLPPLNQHASVSSHALQSMSLRPLRFGTNGEAMSEQLRPRSPEVGLDRIPALHSNIRDPPAFQQSQATKIAELDIINDLLRSRVAQLETSEAAARKNEATIRESELFLRRQVEELQQENKRLRDEMTRTNATATATVTASSPASAANATAGPEPQLKRIKVSELI